MRGVRSLSGLAGPSASLKDAGKDGGGASVVPNTGPSDPTSMALTNTYDLSLWNNGYIASSEGNGQGLAVKDNIVYVFGSSENRMLAIDFSDPANPELAGFVEDATQLVGVSRLLVEGDYLYAVGSNRICVFDISDPRTPVLIGYDSDSQIGSSCYVASNGAGYLFTAEYVGTEQLTSIDVTDPTNPIRRDYITTGFSAEAPRSISYAGDVVYIATYDSGRMLRFNVSNPLNMSYSASSSGAGANSSSGAMITDDQQTLIWVKENYGQVSFYDVSGGVFNTRGSVDLAVPDSPYAAGYVGTTAFAVGGSVHAIDFSDRTAPVELGALDIAGSAINSAVIVADAVVGLAGNSLHTIQ